VARVQAQVLFDFETAAVDMSGCFVVDSLLVPCHAADDIWGMPATVWSRIFCLFVCYLNTLRYKHAEVTFCQFCGGVEHDPQW
jgi:hypothetical protein